MEEYNTQIKNTYRIKINEKRFNFLTAILFVISGITTFISILSRNILFVESNILIFTTLGTILFINFFIDFIHKGNTNSWIYVNYKLNYAKYQENICSHKPSILEGFLSKIFKKNWIHSAIIMPSFIVFYIVMVIGIIGYQKLNSVGLSLVNFAPDISWLFWFPLLWLLTWLANGRMWCQTCPFSGQAEWIQRMHLWRKSSKKLGLNLRWPIKYSTILYSAIGFSVLTWVEEFYNIGGPGIPELTSVVLIYIALLELAIALIFQDRTFCRTLCPLSAPLAVNTMISPLGTFRAKDKEVCKSCSTKDCMKGNDKHFGCPWFASPGSVETSPFCGLASDCYRACPHDNIDWKVKRFPWIDDVIGNNRKRLDIALSVLILTGVVFFQFFNALPLYTMIDKWLSYATGWNDIARILTPGISKYGFTTYGYPMPLDYIILTSVPLIIVYIVSNIRKNDDVPSKAILTSVSYSMIPIFASSILARNLPKLLGGALLIFNEVPYLDVKSYHGIWYTFLERLGSHPSSATAEWWVLIVMEAVLIFGSWLSFRISKELSKKDGIPLSYYLVCDAIISLLFILITYWMSSPDSSIYPFYNKYLGNLIYNPLNADPPF
ncbi:4Fe-4S binding protein [Acidianus brierleyi]|uniref:4Fe-4S binding protein n=1 Tax=Acidianus brierleyi TaxID=41673 RepID=A0A2U9IIL0_9CREN|nr:4Fe-4S binding protein [Acidianus brierleyi]AWR95816.1 4Fe-4S binding protein [Acidianus brierleyi]